MTSVNSLLKFRKMENLHIVFWLFKDISWCMEFRVLGIVMIVPTMVVAIIIAAKTRRYMGEWCHSLATIFWIFANSFWMVCEFFKFEDWVAVAPLSYRQMAALPFTIGILILAYYYLWWKPRHKNEEDEPVLM
jgi:hypothetical protein